MKARVPPRIQAAQMATCHDAPPASGPAHEARVKACNLEGPRCAMELVDGAGLEDSLARTPLVPAENSSSARCVLCGALPGVRAQSACTDGDFRACVLCGAPRIVPCSVAAARNALVGPADEAHGQDPTPSDNGASGQDPTPRNIGACGRLDRKNFDSPLLERVQKVHRSGDDGEGTRLALLGICDEDIVAAKQRRARLQAQNPRRKAKMHSPWD